jgi:parallel beta-helix repeat protein
LERGGVSKRRLVCLLELMLLLVGTLSVALMIKSSPAYTTSSAIYIYSNGDIHPSEAPIVRSGSVYTLSADITSSSSTYGIVVQRNSVILDGSGHLLNGKGGSYGIYLGSVSNVTIRNMSVGSFFYGIFEQSCSNDTVTETSLSHNDYGIYLDSSRLSVISGNNVTQNAYGGICLDDSQNNSVIENDLGNNVGSNGIGGIKIFDVSEFNRIVGNCFTSNSLFGVYVENAYCNSVFHNNFVSNYYQAYVASSSGNTWDDGYPSGGNYWSDYAGQDRMCGPGQNLTGSDGIGDTPYRIGSSDADHYPLMNPWVPPEPPVEPPAEPPADVHLLLTVNPDEPAYVRNQSVTLDVRVFNQSNLPLNSTLALTVTGPGGYCYLDFRRMNVTSNAVGDYSFDWDVPDVAGTYVVEVGFIPPRLTAYDEVWLEAV